MNPSGSMFIIPTENVPEVSIHYVPANHVLVGGFKHFFSIIYGNNPSQLTFIFFKMIETTNQMLILGTVFY